MPGFNQATLIGYVGTDAEVKETKAGPVAAFRLAVTELAGTDREVTTWFNAEVWGDRAKKLAEHITAGRLVCVVGPIRIDQWEDEEGARHQRTRVLANQFQFLDRRPELEEEE